MGQAFDRDGNVLGSAEGQTRQEVFDKLTRAFPDAERIEIARKREAAVADRVYGEERELRAGPFEGPGRDQVRGERAVLEGVQRQLEHLEALLKQMEDINAKRFGSLVRHSETLELMIAAIPERYTFVLRVPFTRWQLLTITLYPPAQEAARYARATGDPGR